VAGSPVVVAFRMGQIAAGTGAAARWRAGWGALLIGVSAVAGCSRHRPELAPAPSTANGGRSNSVVLRDNWRARVVVDRSDSIILTLPSGDHQLQRFSRRAAFTLTIADDGTATLRLDSLALKPRVSGDAGNPIGAVWTGQIAGDHLNAIQVSGGSAGSAAPLTTLVRDLLPRLPAGGARAGLAWSDTSNGPVRVDIFSGSERRTSTWAAGSASPRGGSRVLPVTVREEFEQLGTGNESGRRMSMTSQGSRSGVYYVTFDGRVSDAQLDDSVAMLISITGTRQLVPTTRYSRTSVHFFPLARGQSE
jgi:hypothetical protein